MEESNTNQVEVVIAYWSSPAQFWVQLKKDHEEIIKMKADMLENYSRNSDSLEIKTKPTGSKIYGVLHPLYESWYRAQIEEVYDDDTADVLFVDYGDSYKVPFVNICTLVNRFADIPVFATCYSFNKPSIDCSFCVGTVGQDFFGAKENGLQFVDFRSMSETITKTYLICWSVFNRDRKRRK